MKKTMITSSLLIGYFLFMSSLAATASVPVSVHKNAKEIVRREIIQNITCPDFITENSELNVVKAIVQVNEDGLVSIEEINSGNVELRDNVLKQLQNIRIKNNASVAERFVLVIKFQVQ